MSPCRDPKCELNRSPDGMRVRLSLLFVVLACIAGLVACAWLDDNPLIPASFLLGGLCGGAVLNVWTWSDES